VDRPEAGELVDAFDRLDRLTFDRQAIRANAERFDSALFRERWRELLARLGVDPALYVA
jgi:hypothetical protein